MKAMKSNESIVDKISLKNIYSTDVHVWMLLVQI